MPNHCECELMLKGATVDIGLFLAFVRTTKERDGREEEIVFDFDKILPMPESLQIEAGSRGDDGYLALYGTDEQIAEALAWPRWAGLGLTDRAKLLVHLEKTAPDSLRIGKQYKANLDRYGCTNWYDWNIKNWGTKWNASDSEEKGGKITFQTAWSPPVPVILATSKQFPKLEFVLRFWEGGAGFQGIFKARAGEVMENETRGYKGHRGG